MWWRFLSATGREKNRFTRARDLVGKTLLQHLYRIAANYADIAQIMLFNAEQAMSDPGFVNFDTQIVRRQGLQPPSKPGCRHFPKPISSVTGAVRPKGLGEVQSGAIGIQAKARPQFIHGTLLARGHAACAQHETADSARFREGFLVGHSAPIIREAWSDARALRLLGFGRFSPLAPDSVPFRSELPHGACGFCASR